MSLESNAHEQRVTCFPVFRLIDSPGRPARVITRKISTRIPASQYWDPS